MPHHAAFRAVLLCGTALSAAGPAMAQPAPNARPAGGQVVAGSASIAQSGAATVVTQGSDRAAIDWRSFDVGRNANVTFQQPSASSATLNRVTGPDPSAIAGRISANGQVILTNPNGVTFYKGAQVNAQSVIVSAPGITNQNFMAGRMVFDQAPKPNARVENQGSITVKQAGLAALVAPSVANSGTITARMGNVVLAGAAAHTLDMYGDGLVSIDVTKQVRQLPTGPDGKPVTALVTNTGTIRADGGTIQLTARAADGVVQTLVDAGGTIRADTVGAKPGQIEIAGTGGAVVIAGRVAADGRNGSGGTIVLNGSTATTLTDGAHVSADGAKGGGTIAVGTTLARARTTGPAPAATSARTVVAAGARLSASGRGTGSGGRVTVLSKETTAVAGTVRATGGARGGDGGTIELSGETGFRLTGKADTSAPKGKLGSVVLDPRDLLITDNPPAGTPNQPPADNTDPNIAANAGGTTTDAYVTAAQLENLTGNIHVQTTRDLTIDTSLSLNAPSSTFEAGRNLTVTANGAISTGGNLSLKAASNAIPGYNPAGALTVAGSVDASNLLLEAGSGGIAIGADLSANLSLHISTPGAVTQTAGTISAPQLYGSAGSVSLPNGNQITGVGNGQNASFQTTSGGFLLTNASGGEGPGPLLTIGNANGGGGLFVPANANVTLTTDRIAFAAPAGARAVTATGGTLTIQPASPYSTTVVNSTDSSSGFGLFIDTNTLPSLAVGTLALSGGLNNTVSIDGAADLTAAGIGKLALTAGGGVSQSAPLTVASLSISAGPNSSVTLDNAGNQIAALTSLTANDGVAIRTAGNLALGTVDVDNATITAGGSITQTGGTLSSSGGLSLSAGSAGGISLGGRANANPLTLSSGTGGVALTGGALVTGLSITTTGALTQGAAISATTLSGSAASVNLPAANTIGSVSQFTTNSGDFALATSGTLTVGGSGGISVPAQRTISLTADALVLAGSGTALAAPNGVVVLAPFTAGNGLLLTTGNPAAPANTTVVSTGTLSRVNAYDLILGSQSTGAVTLGQPGEAIDLGTLGFGALGLNSGGSVTQGANSTLTVQSLSANASSLSLINAGNQIQTFYGTSVTGNAALHTDGNLSVGFLNVGGTIALSSGGTGGMTLYGDISGSVVSLNSLVTNATTPTASDPGITQTGGSLSAGTLTGAAGSVQLTQTNAVRALGDFATYGGFTLNDSGTPLVITGAVTSNTGPTTLNSAGLTQTTGTLSTPELDGSSSASTVLTARGNQIAAIGTFTQSAGDFSLVTASPTLTVGAGGGQLSAQAGSVTLVADALSIPSSRTGPAIAAPNGRLTLSPFTAGRPIALLGGSSTNPNALSVNSAMRSQLSAASLVLGTGSTSSAVTIGNAGDTIDLSTLGNALALNTTGAVTEGNNVALSVASLSGTAGLVVLTSPNNAIQSASNLTATSGPLQIQTTTGLGAANLLATGSLSLASGGTLSIAGNLAGSTIALSGATGITQSAGAITTAGALSLSAPGAAIGQTGGTMSAGSLTSTSATLSLPNLSAPTASIAATGTVALTDSVSLSLTGLTASNATIGTAGSLVFAGPATIGGTLALTASGGGISQTAGTITANTLTARAAGPIALSSANPIGTLTTISSAGGFTMVSAGALAVTGPISDGTAVSLRSGGALSIDGAITTGTLTLAAGGAISAPGGTLTASLLTGSGTSATLTGPNRIGTLGDFTVSGALSLTDTTDLAITGAVNAGAFTLAAPGRTVSQTGGGITVASLLATTGTLSLPNLSTPVAVVTTSGAATLNDAVSLTLAGLSAGTNATVTTAGDLLLGGNVDAGGTLQLGTAGTLGQSGGSLSAPTLTTRSGGTTVLTQAVTIGTLAGGSSNGGFTLTDTGSLAVTGTLTDPTAITLRSGGTLAFGGQVSTGRLTVSVPGAITQTGGALAVGTLTGSATSAALTGTNAVGTLGAFTTQGAFALTNGTDLAVAGPLTAGSIGLSTAGTLSLAGTITTPGSLALQAGGDVTQSGGAITAGALTGTARSATLNAAANQIPNLAGFLTTGDFSIHTAGDMLVSGAVDPTTVTLDVGGALTLASSVTGDTVVLRAGSGVISTGGGRVVASRLTAAASNVQLGGDNAIDSLGDIATTGGLTLNSSRALLVAGSIAGGGGGITLAAPSIALAGLVSAPSLSLASPGAVTQTGGSLAVNTLSGSVGSLDLGRSGSASVAALGPLAAARSLAVADAGPLRVTGPLAASSLAVSSAGGLVLAGDSIRSDVASFTVQPGADGRASLAQLGTTTVSSASGRASTLNLSLPASGGTMTFSNLNARGSNVVLDLGSGSATGNLQAGTLIVRGSGGGATLTGTVGARTDGGAAQLAERFPGTDLRYTFNSCAIAAIACGISPAGTDGTLIFPEAAIAGISSTLRPDILTLGILDLSVTRDRDDSTLLLPNISDRDY